jgi:hypothetical protein
MSELNRRHFLTTASRGALAALAAGRVGVARVSAAETPPISSSSPRRLKYVGWQVGVTYQAAAPGGLGRDDMMRLLDAMARHRMNFLSLRC